MKKVQEELKMLRDEVSRLHQEAIENNDAVDLQDLPLGPIQAEEENRPHHPRSVTDVAVRTNKQNVTVKDVPADYTIVHHSYPAKMTNQSKLYHSLLEKRQKWLSWNGPWEETACSQLHSQHTSQFWKPVHKYHSNKCCSSY